MRTNPNLKKGVKLDVPNRVKPNNNDAKGCGLGTVAIVCVLIALVSFLIVVIKFTVPVIIVLFMLLTGGKIGG